MLKMFDSLLTSAPEFRDDKGHLWVVPILVGLNWPMCTSAGLRVFTNPKVNDQLRKILNVWANFLSSPESRYVLTDKPNGLFGPSARDVLSNFEETYECDPSNEYWGFASWDDFFTRRLRPGVRPISRPEDDTVIISACESVAYKICDSAQAASQFWLKGEPYSLNHMLNHDSLSHQFVGGTVYQGFLSAFNYHRWHSPVGGTITKIVHVPGTYCAVSPALELEKDEDTRFAALASQAFLTNLATRVVIFIQSDNTDIGLMCFIAVGMVDVSSCETNVVEGQRVKKGDQLGRFHFGGSTHCLVFRPETKVVFSEAVLQSLEDGKTRIPINSCVGHLVAKSE